MSPSHDEQSAKTFLVSLMYSIFNLYEKNSMDQILTLFIFCFAFKEYFYGFMIIKYCALSIMPVEAESFD